MLPGGQVSDGKFADLKVFLDMLGGMITKRNPFAAANRTAVKIDITDFADHFRLGVKMSLVTINFSGSIRAMDFLMNWT